MMPGSSRAYVMRPVLSDLFRQAIATLAVMSAMRGPRATAVGSGDRDWHANVGRGKTYAPNGERECARRRRQPWNWSEA